MRLSDDGEFVPVHLTAMGVPFVVRSRGNGASALAEEIRHAWAWCLDAEPDPGIVEPLVVDVAVDADVDTVQAYREAGALASETSAGVMHDLSPVVTLRAITRREQELMTLHAGAVAHPVTGATVAFVGASGAGKTTATRVLAREFGYVSDETVALRDDDTLLPYPKPLSVLTGSTYLKDQISPVDAGFVRAPARCHLVKVLFLCRDPEGPLVPELEPVPTVRALAEVAPQISFLATRDHPLQRLASTFRRTGGLERVHYREASELTGLVAALMEGR